MHIFCVLHLIDPTYLVYDEDSPSAPVTVRAWDQLCYMLQQFEFNIRVFLDSFVRDAEQKVFGLNTFVRASPGLQVCLQDLHLTQPP